jgi:hypothetical protein
MNLINPFIFTVITEEPPAGISLVNSVQTYRNEGFNTVGSSSSFATDALEVSSGNLLVVCVTAYYFGVPLTISSLTDTASNTFTLIDTQHDSNNSYKSFMFYAKNAAANAADIITASFLWEGSPCNPSRIVVQVLQYSGCDTTAPLDANVSSSTTYANSTTSDAFTTIATDEVIVMMGSIASTGGGDPPFTPGSGFTVQRQVEDGIAAAVQDKIVSTIQVAATAVLNGPTHYWNNILATFK